jgi:hypothetical protein
MRLTSVAMIKASGGARQVDEEFQRQTFIEQTAASVDETRGGVEIANSRAVVPGRKRQARAFRQEQPIELPQLRHL